MASLFDIGKTAVQAQRQALNVTGQNIANVNTEGYRKRGADLKEVSGSQSGLSTITSQIGLGVALGEVRRAYNVFLTSSTNSSESRFQSSQTFVKSMERLENAILPGEGDLSSQITEFFRTLSDVEVSPGDLAPRAAAIEQGNGLANAFNTTAFVLRDLEAQIFGTLEQEVSEVNRLVESLGSVNGKLRSSNLGASPPNALMDERDRLISEISKKVRISVNYGPRFDVNIRLGEHSTGPVLLDGETSFKVQPIKGNESGVSFKIGSQRVVKMFDDGGLKGLSTALSVIQDTHSQVDALANRLVTELNVAHIKGIDFDGETGQAMFTARQFEIVPDLDNSQELDISVLAVPGKVDLVENAMFRFNGRSGFWTAYNQDNKVLGTGRTQIDLNGIIVKVGNIAKDGDSFMLSKAGGEADRLSFLLTDGKQIAAASNFVITPNSANSGAARLASSAIEMKAPPLVSLTEVTNNSLSPVSYEEFLNGGAVAYIPAGIKNLELASFGQDPSLTINFDKLTGLRSFSFVLSGYTYEASVSKELRESLRGNEHLADYFNSGFITFTKKELGGKTVGTDISLRDIDVFASGFDGGLKLAGSTAFTSGTLKLEVDGKTSVSNAVVKGAETASSFRVFTREGRQVAGVPLSSSEAHKVITETNGFSAEAEYRADYLNPTDGIGYRGAVINNLLPGGYSTIESAASILTGASLGSLVQQGTILNSISAQTLTFETTSMSASGLGTDTADGVVNVGIDVKSGANMKTIAEDINTKLEPYGFLADAKTHASLSLKETGSVSGEISFELSSGNSTPVLISGNITNSDLTPLIGNINQRTDQTGIIAEVSSDGSRIVLIQSDGLDISITKPNGKLLTVNSLDQNFSKLSNETDLNTDTKVIGSLSVRSPRAFKLTSSLDSDAIANSQTLSTEEGGVSISHKNAGSVSELSINVDPDILVPQASPDGLRLAASNTTFTLSAAMNGSENKTDYMLKTNELNDISRASISNALVSKLRSNSAVPSLTGANLQILPSEGSQVSVLVGASEYVIRYESGEFDVQGPESGRVLAEIQTTGTGTSLDPYIDRFVINVPEGVLNGSSIEILDGSDLAEFGLATNETTVMSGVKSRAFSDFSLVSAAKLNGSSSSAISLSSVNDTLSFSSGSWNNGDAITLTLGGVTETITIATDSYANTNAGVATQVKAELDALIAAGTLSNISISDNGAGVLSLAKTFESMVGSTATKFSVSHVSSADSVISKEEEIAIVAGAEYTVSDASVVYNGVTYAAGTTFTGVSSAKTAINAVTSGDAANGKVKVASGFAITSSNSAVTPRITSDKSSSISYDISHANFDNFFDPSVSKPLASSTTQKGTFTVMLDGSATVISIDGSNNTLQGIADEITATSYDITAKLVEGASGLTLQITSSTGAENVSISSTDTNFNIFNTGSPASSSTSAQLTVTSDVSYKIGLDLAYYKSDGTALGPLRITPSAAASALGFDIADFSVELTETGLKTVSRDGDPSGVSLEASNLPGQILSMEGLPNEDFIVLLDSQGAKRLASSFEMSSQEDRNIPKDYRVKVVDAAVGRVELFDVETGTSMATRFTNGVAEFEADNYRLELAGFGKTNDYFDIALNRSNAGDARNMVAMIELSRSTAERSSFQDEFRKIALAVGSQLESGRLLNISATAIRDAAIATEDELAGVNLDEEAGKLMEQQQAYQAAAQILQTARDLFDTIIRIM